CQRWSVRSLLTAISISGARSHGIAQDMASRVRDLGSVEMAHARSDFAASDEPVRVNFDEQDVGIQRGIETHLKRILETYPTFAKTQRFNFHMASTLQRKGRKHAALRFRSWF